MNPMATRRSPTVTLFNVEDPISDRLARLGLTKARLDEKEPDDNGTTLRQIWHGVSAACATVPAGCVLVW